ncbi:hypothetical protein ANCCAN_16616 [Ancylostoma caninum]|uniref:ABC transporter domain-containing protein n=1 Tax=Ancylostoma caninum TaxID=29170 RepID=A0A368FZ70_ANCCA|nr:hypothetical protein ANCCAN_16616 [Ancylostoma caninum]
MGSSGAGKSTLLNILTQKKMRGMRIFGEIAINNQLVEMGDMKKYSAYVQQDDLFIAEMTVQEHLMFAARLRMPSTLSETKRKETVEDVITMVVAALKVLASKGKTVISTIHQPSSQVYELADRLILMAQGQVAYQGIAADVGDFFDSLVFFFFFFFRLQVQSKT